MIRNFDTYKDVDSGGVITEYIVGSPSGEVLDINEDDFVILHNSGIIKYNQTRKYFNFKDVDYERVESTIRKPASNKLIEDYMKVFGIMSYKINKDSSVDVNGSVDISGRRLKLLPFKFGIIYGNFDCSGNNLTNLVNSPVKINGYFDCSDNKLYTLIGGPKIVKGGYYASSNDLEDLYGFPDVCLTSFDCSKNNIITLKGMPFEISCKMDISYNKLRNLSHGPKKTMSFDCNHNMINTLSNGINYVRGEFNCTYNNLKSLMGMPNCNKIIYNDGNKIEEIDYDG